MTTQERELKLVRDVADILMKSEEGRTKVSEVLLMLLKDMSESRGVYPIPKDYREICDYTLGKLRSHGVPLQEHHALRTKLVDSSRWQDLAPSGTDDGE